MNNMLLIDKPEGWTSFDVVAKIRSRLKGQGSGRVKVGHAGTLDPFATGLLIILLGDSTKKQDSFMKLDKEYEARVELGKISTTQDPEGEITKTSNYKPSVSEIKNVLIKFMGEQQQVPPRYSAIKVSGKRAYELARANAEFNLKPRKVTIFNLEINNYNYPVLEISIKCSSGTYIRSLAEDIGKTLGTGAYLTGLRRTAIGSFEVNNAQTVEQALKELNTGLSDDN